MIRFWQCLYVTPKLLCHFHRNLHTRDNTMLPHLTIILLQPNHESFQSCGMNVLSIMFECILRLYKCFHRTRKLQDRICILNLPKTLPQQYGNSKQHQSKEGWRWNSNAARPNTTIYQGDDHNQFPLIQGNNFYLSCTQNWEQHQNAAEFLPYEL